jgi:hypothetical protein
MTTEEVNKLRNDIMALSILTQERRERIHMILQLETFLALRAIADILEEYLEMKRRAG